jgi:aerobic carbon-monoxide dehydrogenase medium subunit
LPPSNRKKMPSAGGGGHVGMKASAFAYTRATSVANALELLAAHGDRAKVLSGGQSLIPAMNLRLICPELIVDIGDLVDLSGVAVKGDILSIGALTRHVDLQRSPEIAAHAPLLRDAIGHVAHPAIRNRGTIGGSLSHADPAAELPMLSLFYGATMSVQGPEGRRTIAAEDFFVDALTNCLEPEEIVIEIEFPIQQHDGWAFEEVARRFGDFALASIAVSVRRNETRIDDARVAVMGVADTPLRLRQVEAQLGAIEVDDKTPDRFAELVTSSVSANGDLHASAEYRQHLLGQLARRAMQTALAARR